MIDQRVSFKIREIVKILFVLFFRSLGMRRRPSLESFSSLVLKNGEGSGYESPLGLPGFSMGGDPQKSHPKKPHRHAASRMKIFSIYKIGFPMKIKHFLQKTHFIEKEKRLWRTHWPQTKRFFTDEKTFYGSCPCSVHVP